MNLSSERSEYSPTIRLAIGLPLTKDSLDPDVTTVLIRVDSGVVAAYGALAPTGLVVMRNLRVSALIAEFPAASVRRGTLEHPWKEIARSAEQPLADSLRYGERAPLAPMRFAIAVQSARLAAANGLVFEITGNAMSTPLRMATGELRPGRMMGKGSIRVFACSTFRLNGSIDRGREKSLSGEYMKSC